MDSLEIGSQYSAEKILPNKIWISLGGQKSTKNFLKPKKNFKNSTQNIENSPFLSSFSSFDLIEIKSNLNLKQDKLVIKKPDIFTNNFTDIVSNIPKYGFIWDIGIHIEIQSEILSIFQEGWIHRHVIEILNEIRGIEYNSNNYFPSLIVSRDLINLKNPSNLFDDVFSYLISQLKLKFSEIDKIHINVDINSQKEIPNRNEIENILKNKRERNYSLHNSIQKNWKDLDGFYSFSFDSKISPFFLLILTNNNSDPAGYLNYNDFNDEYFSKKLKKKYKIEKKTLGKLINSEKAEFANLNFIFHENSFGLISKIELASINNPIPSSPNSEILLFPIPDNLGFGLISQDFSNKVFSNISYQDLIEEKCDGHQHSNFQSFSLVQIYSQCFKENCELFGKIGWMNKTLLTKLKNLNSNPMLNYIATENEAKDVETYIKFLKKVDHPLLKSTLAKETYYDHITGNELIQTQDIEKILSNPIHCETLSLTLLSKDQNEFEIEFKNLHLTADSFSIKKIRRKK